MSDTSLKFLAAAADHERQQAEVIAAGVPAAENALARAQAALAAAEVSLGEAEAAADLHEDRARAAQAALDEALADASPEELADAGLSGDAVEAAAASADGSGASRG